MSSVQEQVQELLKLAGDGRGGLKRAAAALDRLPDAERKEARSALRALAGAESAIEDTEGDEGELTDRKSVV